ncbi:MAG: hypothetical protein EGQ45_01090, partial [Clostridiales bacterium]|nr:hypothetical protein [Clostridiales bacterium]
DQLPAHDPFGDIFIFRHVIPAQRQLQPLLPRAQAQGEAISASHVRQLIHDGQMEAIRPLVPETTYAYLSGKAGKNAVARICAAACSTPSRTCRPAGRSAPCAGATAPGCCTRSACGRTA